MFSMDFKPHWHFIALTDGEEQPETAGSGVSEMSTLTGVSGRQVPWGDHVMDE